MLFLVRGDLLTIVLSHLLFHLPWLYGNNGKLVRALRWGSIFFRGVCNLSKHFTRMITVRCVYSFKAADPPENTSLTLHHGNTSAIASGTLVSFTCSSAAFPAPHAFKLLVDGREVHSSSSETFSVAVTQSGVYSCEAVNTVGSQRSNNVTVTVFGKCPYYVCSTRDTLPNQVFMLSYHFSKQQLSISKQTTKNKRMVVVWLETSPMASDARTAQKLHLNPNWWSSTVAETRGSSMRACSTPVPVI